MWWLENSDFDHRSNDRKFFLRGRDASLGFHSRPPQRRVSTLTDFEKEANKRLLEAAVCGDSLLPRLKKDVPKVVSQVSQKAPASSADSGLKSKDTSLKCLQQQLKDLQSVIGDQASDRERGRVREQWLRRQLIASESKTSELQEQLIESRQELDLVQGAAAQQMDDLNRQHESDMEYLRAVSHDAERRASLLDAKMKEGAASAQQHEVTYEAQMERLRSVYALEVQEKENELSNASRLLEELQAQLVELQGKLKISESICDVQSKKIARIL
ncbi:MAG: hypothetical protein AAGG48_17095 [Planctomycetota bacterium]